ncbi:hypothetical protein NGA_0380100 [Nannochloropsis gaditana CCMP526]|uniref:uncharacterized protein n=1 Tax=Nannochloropsis gaditana (strain CCMP526) TaxID=1093141 RepID=UPI00029F6F6D|nr:hypothetical protein NGA_0380100 [Nannochloropsis gaditana CCMP526]EKU21597.1 hypothetical protein NGA_0380100 [Nannochloropsis gaditana CCMP526]|eukprot:XP_005854762.1 hypothetical protein NGA_0380100 [Nannochloropsis gaditana CCMP526]
MGRRGEGFRKGWRKGLGGEGGRRALKIVSLPERGVSTHFGAMRLWSHSHPSRSICPPFSPPSSLPRLLPPLPPSLAHFLPPLPPAALDGIETAVRSPQESFLEEMESFQHHVKRTLRELCDGIAIEAQAREEEDCLVLDAMLEAQKSLQRIILENYGGRPIGPGEDAEDSFLLRLYVVIYTSNAGVTIPPKVASA